MPNHNRDDQNLNKPAPADDQEDSEASNARNKTDEALNVPTPDVTTNPSIKNY